MKYCTDVSPCKKVWFEREVGVADAVQLVSPSAGWSEEGGAWSHWCELSDTTSDGSTFRKEFLTSS